MMRMILTRGPASNEGTPGILVSENQVFKCATGEPPWIDQDGDGKRDSGLSRIKAGEYCCLFTVSPSRKNPDGTPEATYELQDTPDAAGVRMHAGNFCGDTTKGYLSDSQACILVGADWADMPIPDKKRHLTNRTHQRGVTASRQTLATLHTFLNRGPFTLVIVDAPLG